LLRDLGATLGASEIVTAKAERLLTSIGQTYKPSPASVPRLALLDPYLKLVSIPAEWQLADKSALMTFKALECLGFMINGPRLAALSGKPFEVEKWLYSWAG
jgi:hypothetical protein